MFTELPGSAAFATDFSAFDVVGFHATSVLASAGIEETGLYPHKIFSADVHNKLLRIAREAKPEGFNIVLYEQWLEIHSVTLAKEETLAFAHVKDGHSGGQGLKHLKRLVDVIDSNPAYDSLIDEVRRHIAKSESSAAVIYAIDLSGLGGRIEIAPDQHGLYRVYFDPRNLSDAANVIHPKRLIAKLTL